MRYNKFSQHSPSKKTLGLDLATLKSLYVMKFTLLAIIILLSACSGHLLRGGWYNTNPRQINITNQVSFEGNYIVTITNTGDRPVRYVGLVGHPELANFKLVVLAEGKENIIDCNSGELVHDYTLSSGQSLKLKVSHQNVVRIGLPVYNEKFESETIWHELQDAM